MSIVVRLLALSALVLRSHADEGCESGWTRFDRPSGGWCIQVFTSANTPLTTAAQQCENRGAVLSGVQSADELAHIHQTASSTLPANTGSLWVGAARTAACVGKKLTATCTQKTSFRWTDGSATGTDGFSWFDASQPDNAHGGNQDCIAMFYAPSLTSVKGVLWPSGAMDDVACDGSQLSGILERQIRGYVCGKAATVSTTEAPTTEGPAPPVFVTPPPWSP